MNIVDLLNQGILGPYQKVTSSEVKIHCPFPERHKGRRDSNPSCNLNTQKLVFHCWSCGAKGHINSILKSIGSDIYNLQPTLNVNFRDKVTKEIYLDPIILECWNYIPYIWAQKFPRYVLEQHQIGYDFPNQRITVPIFDEKGRLVAISGRSTFSKSVCKEKNIPRYKVYIKELYDYLPFGYRPPKGAHLWRQHLIKNFDEIIVVEGFKAAMWCVAAGIPNVVATMGASYTQKQVYKLINMDCRKYTILFDGNKEAVKLAHKLEITLKSEGMVARVIELPEDAQPDDYTFFELKKLIFDS